MKRVYVGRQATEVHMLADLLGAENIQAVTRGFDSTWGTNPMVEPPSVWILHEADFERAMKIVEEYSRREGPKYDATTAWQCDECGETVEDQYGACWKCSAPRPEALIPTSSPGRGDTVSQPRGAMEQKPGRVLGFPLKLSLIIAVGLALWLIGGLPQTVWILYFTAALLVVVDHVLS